MTMTDEQIESGREFVRENAVQERIDEGWSAVKVEMARLNEMQVELDKRRLERRRAEFKPTLMDGLRVGSRKQERQPANGRSLGECLAVAGSQAK